jgi:DNA gyrase/topoisomerase IV subunit A
MKNIVSNLYADYLRYTDRFRAIPWEVDMLKPVERRALLSIHEVAKTKFTKTAKVIGHIIGNYHPHGDLAVKDVLTNMVQSGYAEGQGNWGNDENISFIPAGAARYTEIKAIKFLDDGFSEFLDFVPWEDFEYEKEPHYLPFYLPIGLIGDGLIQGISLHTTKIPKFDFIQLGTRLYELLMGLPKTTIKPIIKNCDIFEDKPGEFERILNTGEGIIYAIPKYKIVGNSIYIYGKTPSGFSKVLAFNEKYEENNSKAFATIIDNSGEKLEVIISPKKGSIDQKFIDQIMNLVMEKIHIKCHIVVESGSVELKGIDSILINSYSKWKDSYLAKISKDLVVTQNKLEELNVVLVIRSIIENNPTVKTIQEICSLNTSKYPNSSIETICSKYRIKTLIEANIDIPGVQTEINNLQNEITNIDTFALNRVKSIIGK